MEVMEDVIAALLVLARLALFIGVIWLIVRDVRKSGRSDKK